MNNLLGQTVLGLPGAFRIPGDWMIAIRWHCGDSPGTKREAYIDENAGAADVHLSDDDIARLDAVTVVGDRTADLSWTNRSTPPVASGS